MTRISLLTLPLLLVLAVVLCWPAPRTEAGKLADDGRAGAVLDVQGTALVRPAGRTRWTPLGPKSLLFPGDHVRTAARGAHALEFQVGKGRVLVGPGAELLLPVDGGVRLLRGEIEARGREAAPLPVYGPGDFGLKVLGTVWLRAQGKTSRQLDQAPRWVEGYRASASDEWMGALLAQVDGRDVPLAVGYHKVDVEVRDQIARTTVEQSFVNSTNARLEGVFYFPLPADASISGFGMWIGGELVEADIVERQRARQIYEDILRRKKDPGLLEWEGGNLFKARVFPIEPHAEKRIRIRYTQVLPLQGDRYRYRYALRSELLRSKPLRELQLTVRVVSATPITGIASPTHECVIEAGAHEATATFRASEYRPERDFEVAVTLQRTAALTALPHRRGDDGYFALLLAPPDAAGAWQRELVPEGAPLDLILVADTSGSMDAGARRNQSAFLDALLALLGETDRFRLMACDVDATWLVEQPTAATEDAVAAALDALSARRSLGWTDLDRALDAALQAAAPGSLVVYVGDGVGTTGDALPAALAARLRARGRDADATVHAVAPGSSYETAVLQALARIGGGSVRAIGASPAQAAFGLLGEAARPAVKDLEVRIDGLRTARVYPAELPNLPLGAQQVVLGRFLPADEPQEGRVVVKGTLQGKEVTYTAALHVPAADVGNSFLPRLWGRMHIDALLAEGRAPAIQEEIVAFSERFGIMTPYTSFLVLESDEDRERYGVDRRVRMRDGERFFAEAKDRATLELRRTQMKAAGRWRVGLRRRMLQEIARLGRDLPILSPEPKPDLETVTEESAIQIGGGAGGSWGLPDRGLKLDRLVADERRSADGYFGAEGGEAQDEEMEVADQAAATPPPAASPTTPSLKTGAPRRRAGRKLAAEPARESWDPDAPAQEAYGESVEDMDEDLGDDKSVRAYARGGLRSRSDELVGYSEAYSAGPEMLRRPGGPRRAGGFTLQALGFPLLPTPPTEDEGGEGEPWNEEVLALLRSLPRREAVGALDGGLHVVLDHANLHPTRGLVLGAARTEAWLGRAAWRVSSDTRQAGEPYEEWVAAGRRGALARARQLARTRKAQDADGDAWWLPLWDLRVRDVIRSLRRQGFTATITTREGDRVTVTFRAQAPDAGHVVLVVDTARRVVLEQRAIDGRGKPAGRILRKDFVEVAGRWWARTIEQYDRKDRLVGRTRVTVEALTVEALAQATAQIDTLLGEAVVVHGPLPTAVEAKQARHEKRAGFVDHLVLALVHGQRQQWDESLAAWEAAAASIASRPGRRWIFAEFLGRARRGETFKTWLNELVPLVAERTGGEGRFLAQYLHAKGAGILGATEAGALLERLKERWILAGRPGHEARREHWMLLRAALLQQAGKAADARALRAAVAEAFPYSLQAQQAHEADLWGTGRRDEALAASRRLLSEREPWLAAERDAIHARLADRLWTARRLDDLDASLAQWVSHDPETRDAYWRRISSHYFRGDEQRGDEAVTGALGLRPLDASPEHEWARLEAGVDLALGGGWNFQGNRIESRWADALAALCAHLWRSDVRHAAPTSRIYSDWRFRRTDAWRTLGESLRQDVLAPASIDAMPPERLGRYVAWLPWGREAVDEAAWRRVTDAVKARWRAATQRRDRAQFGSQVLILLDARGEREEAIAFARARLAAAAPRERAERANDLFNRLLATPERDAQATPTREDELVGLLPHLPGPDATPQYARVVSAQSVRRLAERMYAWRYEAGLGTPEERAPLTRAAHKALRKEVRQRVREALVERFAAAEQIADDLAGPWLRLERLAYAVEAGADLPGLVREATALLDGPWARPTMPLDRLQRERIAAVLAYACTRRGVPSELVDLVLARMRSGEAADAAREPSDEGTEPLLDWRYQVFRLLVALDRAEALETELQAWIVPAQVESRWRRALGYLQAETGRLREAAEQFAAVHALGELGPDDYAVLADWYLVLTDPRREAMLDARYDTMNEYALSSLLWGHERRLGGRQAGVPEDFDPETLRVLRALLRKAQRPENYWYRVRNLYRGRKDHRILVCVSDALIGHTKEGIYGFLRRLQQLAAEVHEEATCDALVAGLEAAVGGAKRPLDRRALRLAISIVEGRASQVPETDPAHGARALQALQAAFQLDWQDGERRLMAGYLRGLGKVLDHAVAAEQIRQLEALHDALPTGTVPRLAVSQALGETYRTYGRLEDGLAVVETALRATREQNEGRVPHDGTSALDTYVTWLQEAGRFGTAERWLLDERERWVQPARRTTLLHRLFTLYVAAVQKDGSVSLGRGEDLFHAAGALMEKTLLEDPAAAGPVLSSLCLLHRRAAERRAPANAGALLEAYGRERLPALLARLPVDGTQRVRTVAQTLRRLNGPASGLSFLLDRRDVEPSWLGRLRRDIWNQAAYDFARWRHEAGRIGPLAPRLKALVLSHLEQNLIHDESTGGPFWTSNHKWFWGEQADAFADVAGRVAELHEHSPAILMRAANVLWHALGRHRRATAILLAAHARGQLDESQRWRLTEWLSEEGRWAEALPLIDTLRTERPDVLHYRLRLAEVLHGLGREDEALGALEAAERHFRESKLYAEGTAAGLGTLAAKLGHAKPAARWLDEAIRLRQEATGHRGGADSRLSAYYRALASARADLGQTAQAVNAAATAILSANPRRGPEVQGALNALRDALERARDLDAYVAAYEGEVKKTQMDAPVIRKALAAVMTKQGRDGDAVHHLRAARDLAAGDAAIHQGLVAAYDRLGNGEGAIEALFGSIRLAPHNLEAYGDLAARYERAARPADAERARTSMVETSPHQPEGHRRLGAFFEQAGREADAVVQWRQAVRTGALDPTNWLALARILHRTGATADARATLEHVLGRRWEERFGDVKKEAAALLQTLPE